MVYDPEQKKLVCPYCGSSREDMPQGKETDGRICPGACDRLPLLRDMAQHRSES